MRALVVYESMFGNTKKVAESIAAGLSASVRVELKEVGSAPTVIAEEVGLLLVGGPTHAFGMSRSNTRANARDQVMGHVVSQGDGIREWLNALERPSHRVVALAFDTRVKVPFLRGSAAKGAWRQLRRLGFVVDDLPVTFWVRGNSGPLRDGELQRAKELGVRTGAIVARRVAA